MKKKWIYGSLSVIVVLGISMLWYIWPKSFDKTLEGVKYQLGSENSKYVETISVEWTGTLQRNLFKNSSFHGTVKINGESVPSAEAIEKEVSINLNSEDGGLIQYSIPKGEAVDFITYGTLYTNSDFSEMTIAIFEQTESGEGWSGEDGQMISTPANTREEALAISNKWMNSVLVQPLK